MSQAQGTGGRTMSTDAQFLAICRWSKGGLGSREERNTICVEATPRAAWAWTGPGSLMTGTMLLPSDQPTLRRLRSRRESSIELKMWGWVGERAGRAGSQMMMFHRHIGEQAEQRLESFLAFHNQIKGRHRKAHYRGSSSSSVS
ncbi:hypothetical protein PM082_002208 [Marasmius tenuissimus]|nr:hypothetical protein PM082_002208 [Marasmius tenuissimus]